MRVDFTASRALQRTEYDSTFREVYSFVIHNLGGNADLLRPINLGRSFLISKMDIVTIVNRKIHFEYRF